MADTPASKPPSPADERRTRLAQNLRANLRRRKQQTRQRSQEPKPPSPASEASEPSST